MSLTTRILALGIFASNTISPTALQVGAVSPRRHIRSHAKDLNVRQSTVELQTYSSVHNDAYYVNRESFTENSRRRRDRLLAAASRARRPVAGAAVILSAAALFGGIGENLLLQYTQSMASHPLQTKVATGAVLATVGDALAQRREVDKPYDRRRAASFAAFDSCYRVFQHAAFPLIIATCQGRFLGNILSSIPSLASVGANMEPFLAVTERTMAYQFGVVPLLYYPVFFCFTGFMQGLTLRGTLERAAANFLPCWKRNLQFWIPTQYVMFGLIQEHWQIPFVCVMGMIWSTILSVTAGKAKKEKTA